MYSTEYIYAVHPYCHFSDTVVLFQNLAAVCLFGQFAWCSLCVKSFAVLFDVNEMTVEQARLKDYLRSTSSSLSTMLFGETKETLNTSGQVADV